MKQDFTPKLLFAGLLMLAMAGMTSCNDGSSENTMPQPEQQANGQDNVVAASDDDHDSDSDTDTDDDGKDLEILKRQCNELKSHVTTLESQLSEYNREQQETVEKLGKDISEFSIFKFMAILAIAFSVISIAISVMLNKTRSRQKTEARQETSIATSPKTPVETDRQHRNSQDNRATVTQLQDELLSIKNQLKEASVTLASLRAEVTRLKTAAREPQRHAQQQTPPPIDRNPRKTDSTPKPPTKTVYFEETRNGRFENASETEEDGYSNYVCHIAGDTAVFEPINNLERLKSADHIMEAVTFTGDKATAREAVIISPGKAERDGSGWRITKKAEVRFK